MWDEGLGSWQVGGLFAMTALHLREGYTGGGGGGGGFIEIIRPFLAPYMMKQRHLSPKSCGMDVGASKGP